VNLPDWGYVPPGFRQVTIPAGTGLSRIYRRDLAAAKGYSALSFNPTSWKSDPRLHARGGRFDATRRDKFAYLYAASGRRPHAKIAVWEVLAHKRVVVGKGPQLLAASLFAGYAVRYLVATADLLLVDLLDEPALTFFNGDIDSVTRTPDYYQSREWGRYVRQHTTTCCGFAYTSRRMGSTASGYAFVLFDDRKPVARPVRAEGRPVELLSRRGREILDDALHGSNVAIDWTS
jgi:hypothetical protein